MEFIKSLTFTNKEFKKLEKEWFTRMKHTGGIIYDYKMKELIKSFIEDLQNK